RGCWKGADARSEKQGSRTQPLLWPRRVTRTGLRGRSANRSGKVRVSACGAETGSLLRRLTRLAPEGPLPCATQRDAQRRQCILLYMQVPSRQSPACATRGIAREDV